jgi:hypothetical protein
MAAAKNSKAPPDEKFQDQDFELFKALEALDKKDYSWFSRLTEEQQRKFVPYMLLHWSSAVKAGGLMGAYYVISTDANANKHMFNEYVQKHPELQWLMLCAVSPGSGKQFHQWIPHLSDKIGQLKDKAKEKDVLEYFGKIYKGVDPTTVSQAAVEFTENQNHRYRLAKIYPELKLEDIEVLSRITTPEDIDEYERMSGN